MRVILTILFLSYIVPSFSQNLEEFTGPFASWCDVKKRCGAYGDGVHDDTKAIQKAIDGLANYHLNVNTGGNAYTVVYLPKGTYKISQTLYMAGQIGVSIIGEDPANTKIIWAGHDKDTMLWLNGSAYFSIARLSWNANSRNAIEAIGIHWKNRWNTEKSRSYASENMEIVDNFFEPGLFVGIGGGSYFNEGFTGSNDSEIAIRRCIFNKMVNAGIDIKGFNALDYWVWDCKFYSCYKAVSCWHGNYHIFNAYFENSRRADVFNFGGYYTSVRYCVSNNSTAFSVDSGASCNPFKRVFESNEVNSYTEVPIHYSHLGKKLKSKNVVEYSSWCPGMYEMLSLDNDFGSDSAVLMMNANKKMFTYNDKFKYVAGIKASKAFTMNPSAKTERKKFDVPANATAAQIQDLINQANDYRGKRPVIHFPAGKYVIDQTLEIPANSDIQFIGDGLALASMIIPGNPKLQTLHAGAMFFVNGPSYVSFKNLQLNLDGQTTTFTRGVYFENIDQKDSRLFMDQIATYTDSTLLVTNNSGLYIQKTNSFFSIGNFFLYDKPFKSSNRPKAYFFGGQFVNLTVNDPYIFVAKDCWWEGAMRRPLNLTGSGDITIDGALLSPQSVDTTPTIIVNKFDGKISIMNMYLFGGLYVTPTNPDLSLLIWNIHVHHKKVPLDFVNKSATYKGAYIGLTQQCFDNTDPYCKNMNSIADKWVNQKDDSKFLKELTTTGHDAKFEPYAAKPAGVSNIYFSRVSFGRIPVSIEVKGTYK